MEGYILSILQLVLISGHRFSTKPQHPLTTADSATTASILPLPQLQTESFTFLQLNAFLVSAAGFMTIAEFVLLAQLYPAALLAPI